MSAPFESAPLQSPRAGFGHWIEHEMGSSNRKAVRRAVLGAVQPPGAPLPWPPVKEGRGRGWGLDLVHKGSRRRRT